MAVERSEQPAVVCASGKNVLPQDVNEGVSRASVAPARLRLGHSYANPLDDLGCPVSPGRDGAEPVEFLWRPTTTVLDSIPMAQSALKIRGLDRAPTTGGNLHLLTLCALKVSQPVLSIRRRQAVRFQTCQKV